MRIRELTVDQYRGFASRASLSFDPQFTLLVGENGMGKTSLLHALRVASSHTVAALVKGTGKGLRFRSSDITREWPYMLLELVAEVDSTHIATCSIQKNRSSFVSSSPSDGNPRESTVSTPDKYSVTLSNDSISESATQSAPLVVYYSAHRSLALERGPSKARAAGGPSAAYADALTDRELRIGEAALLWKKEAELQRTDGLPARANSAIELALPTFMGDFSNLRVEGDEDPRLVVDKQGTRLDLTQLSDGERGLLTVLIDLSRRLAQANPSLANPAYQGCAVVLIDELDLHMHPRWQREIVGKLTQTFPNCQFISTTHSPQVIGEMQPEQLLLLRRDNGQVLVEPCGQAYGLDANYVLKHIMGATVRADAAMSAIRAVQDAIDEPNLELARSRLNELRDILHGDDPAVAELEATINNLEALADAPDSEGD